MCLLWFLVLLAGCREVAPDPLARVQIDRLVVLHPGHAMLLSLDRRLVSLQEQRRQISAVPVLPPPPPTAAIATPALPALPEPIAFPAFNRHTDELLEQESAALRRAFEREKAQKLAAYAEELKAKSESGLFARKQAQATAAQQRRLEVLQAHQVALTNARLALKFAQTDPTNQERLAKAQAQYTKANDAYQAALTQANAELAADVRKAEQAAELERKRQLAKREQQLRMEFEVQYQVERERIAAELALEPVEITPAPMRFPAEPAGSLTLDTGTLSGAMQQRAADAERGQAAALRQIDETMTRLYHERRQLQTAIREETQAAVEAVLAQHHYRLAAPGQRAPEKTAEVRGWLQEYW